MYIKLGSRLQILISLPARPVLSCESVIEVAIISLSAAAMMYVQNSQQEVLRMQPYILSFP